MLLGYIFKLSIADRLSYNINILLPFVVSKGKLLARFLKASILVWNIVFVLSSLNEHSQIMASCCVKAHPAPV
uniref:Uncharacterized protein n=1 Tax=Lepeophtheirus salmonis TaxID=72036 RepID=A0A0K2TQF9_LEPSM